jgi:hypothetical protein
MKRVVYDWVLPLAAAALTLAVVAITGGGAGATYLIAFGFGAILMGIRLGPERVRLRRAEREASAGRQ